MAWALAPVFAFARTRAAAKTTCVERSVQRCTDFWDQADPVPPPFSEDPFYDGFEDIVAECRRQIGLPHKSAAPLYESEAERRSVLEEKWASKLEALYHACTTAAPLRGREHNLSLRPLPSIKKEWEELLEEYAEPPIEEKPLPTEEEMQAAEDALLISDPADRAMRARRAKTRRFNHEEARLAVDLARATLHWWRRREIERPYDRHTCEGCTLAFAPMVQACRNERLKMRRAAMALADHEIRQLLGIVKNERRLHICEKMWCAISYASHEDDPAMAGPRRWAGTLAALQHHDLWHTNVAVYYREKIAVELDTADMLERWGSTPLLGHCEAIITHGMMADGAGDAPATPVAVEEEVPPTLRRRVVEAVRRKYNLLRVPFREVATRETAVIRQGSLPPADHEARVRHLAVQVLGAGQGDGDVLDVAIRIANAPRSHAGWNQHNLQEAAQLGLLTYRRMLSEPARFRLLKESYVNAVERKTKAEVYEKSWTAVTFALSSGIFYTFVALSPPTALALGAACAFASKVRLGIDGAAIAKRYPGVIANGVILYPEYRAANAEFTAARVCKCEQCDLALPGRSGPYALISFVTHLLGHQEAAVAIITSASPAMTLLTLVAGSFNEGDTLFEDVANIVCTMFSLPRVTSPHANPNATSTDVLAHIEARSLSEALASLHSGELAAVRSALNLAARARPDTDARKETLRLVVSDIDGRIAMTRSCMHVRDSRMAVGLAALALIAKACRPQSSTSRLFTLTRIKNGYPTVVQEITQAEPTAVPAIEAAEVTLVDAPAEQQETAPWYKRWTDRVASWGKTSVTAHGVDAGSAMMHIKCNTTGIQCKAVIVKHRFPTIAEDHHFLVTTSDLLPPVAAAGALTLVVSRGRSINLATYQSKFIVQMAPPQLRGDRPLGVVLIPLNTAQAHGILAALNLAPAKLAPEAAFKSSACNKMLHTLRDQEDRVVHLTRDEAVYQTHCFYPQGLKLTYGDCGSPLTLNGEVLYVYCGAGTEAGRACFLRCPVPPQPQVTLIPQPAPVEIQSHGSGMRATSDPGWTKDFPQLVERLGRTLRPAFTVNNKDYEEAQAWTTSEYVYMQPSTLLAFLGLAFTTTCKPFPPEPQALAAWIAKIKEKDQQCSAALAKHFDVIDVAKTKGWFSVIELTATTSQVSAAFKTWLGRRVRPECFAGVEKKCELCGKVGRTYLVGVPRKTTCTTCCLSSGISEADLFANHMKGWKAFIAQALAGASWRAFFAATTRDEPMYLFYRQILERAFNQEMGDVAAYLTGKTDTCSAEALHLGVFAKEEVCKKKKACLGGYRVVNSPSIFLNAIMNQVMYRDAGGVYHTYDLALAKAAAAEKAAGNHDFDWYVQARTTRENLDDLKTLKNCRSWDFSAWDKTVPCAAFEAYLLSRWPHCERLPSALLDSAQYNIKGKVVRFADNADGTRPYCWPSGVVCTYVGNSLVNAALQEVAMRELGVAEFGQRVAGDDVFVSNCDHLTEDAIRAAYAKFGLVIKKFDQEAQFCGLTPGQPVPRDAIGQLKKQLAHPKAFVTPEWSFNVGISLGVELKQLGVTERYFLESKKDLLALLRTAVSDAAIHEAYDRGLLKGYAHGDKVVDKVSELRVIEAHGRGKNAHAKKSAQARSALANFAKNMAGSALAVVMASGTRGYGSGADKRDAEVGADAADQLKQFEDGNYDEDAAQQALEDAIQEQVDQEIQDDDDYAERDDDDYEDGFKQEYRRREREEDRADGTEEYVDRRNGWLEYGA